MGEIKIRNLKVKDISTLAKILKKLMRAGRDLVPKISSTVDTAANSDVSSDDDAERVGSQIIDIGIGIIENLVTVADEDVLEFFGDLIGKSKEEFEDMPMEAVGEIITQLRTQPAAESFFTTFSSFVKKNPFFATMRERFSTFTDTTSELVELNSKMKKSKT